MVKQRKKRKSKTVEQVYKTTVKFLCPIRGLVEQEVEVRRFVAEEPAKGKEIGEDNLLIPDVKTIIKKK